LELFGLCPNAPVPQRPLTRARYALNPQICQRRKIHIVGAGALDAASEERPESTPRLYSLLEVARDYSKIRVHTRWQRKEYGAWRGFAIWQGDRPGEFKSYYDIPLK